MDTTLTHNREICARRKALSVSRAPRLSLQQRGKVTYNRKQGGTQVKGCGEQTSGLVKWNLSQFYQDKLRTLSQYKRIKKPQRIIVQPQKEKPIAIPQADLHKPSVSWWVCVTFAEMSHSKDFQVQLKEAEMNSEEISSIIFKEKEMSSSPLYSL